MIDINSLLKAHGMFTFQEHALMGSTTHQEWAKEPYRPGAVIEGRLSPDECNKQRQEQGKIGGVPVGYYDLNGFWGVVTLESLDENGRTVRDPVLVERTIDGVGREKTLSYRGPTLGKPFPFARDGPRVELEEDGK